MIRTLEELSAAALARPDPMPAIEYQHHWISWGELRRIAGRVTALIDASGAAPRAPVAFVARNRPSAIAALLGLIARSSTVRMLYAFQSGSAIGRDIERLDPGVVVLSIDDDCEEIHAALRARGIAAIALRELDAASLPGFEHSRRAPDAQDPAQPQFEILTSGTTGAPKPFAISYEMLARHFVGGNQPGAGVPQAAPPLLFFPLGNISGLYSTLPALLKGERAVLLERFSVAGWHDYVLRHRPEASGMPPAGVQMVLDADIPRADLASIRRLGTGAAPLDPSVQRAFEERYGIPILLSYGATEFGGPVSAMTAELHAAWGARKFGTVGRALPGAQLRIVDPETGAVQPPGTEGLLEVVSPRIGPDWICTSDIALIDEDGFLFHRGRADGAIVRGGFKLLPETIERALLLHATISAAGVVGIADHRVGQVPVAAVQIKPGVEAPTQAELVAHLRAHVHATHIPVAWRFVDSLPRTPSMKVDLRALRGLFEREPLG